MSKSLGRIKKDDKGILRGAIFGFAGINELAEASSIEIESGQCVEIVNCDIDDEHNATRRQGYILASAAVIHSPWEDPAGPVYCVVGSKLCTFDGAIAQELITDFDVLNSCEFTKVNDVVVFSDNEKIGIITSAGAVSRIDIVADWVDSLTLETWVTDHYPADPAAWDGTDSNSNFEVDAFKLATLAGKCLHHFNGALYLAIDNFVYATKTHDIENMDIRYNVIAGFDAPVTMISHVASGLFVGTTKGLYFLNGTGLVIDESGRIRDGFVQTQIANLGVFYGSCQEIESKYLLCINKADGVIPVFATESGIFAGMNGGSVYNISAEKIMLSGLDTTARLTSLFKRSNNLCQYIAIYPGTTNALVINTNNGDHSRYTNYPFDYLFNLGSVSFAASGDGVYELSGELDISAQIFAYVTTPDQNFDSRKMKTVTSVYVESSSSGELSFKITADQTTDSGNLPVYFDGITGPHARRGKAPKKLRGTNLQFSISNVGGCRFTLYSLDVEISELSRTHI